MLTIRPLFPTDREPLAALLSRTPEFSADETATALELIDEVIGRGVETTYRALVAIDEERWLGYVCYGPTPMTLDTWDLYWIVAAPEARGEGVGRALHEACLGDVARSGGRRVRIETSTREGYGATLAFYDRLGYERVGVITDFYAPGDDLVTSVKRV